jgi:hypothetical protein
LTRDYQHASVTHDVGQIETDVDDIIGAGIVAKNGRLGGTAGGHWSHKVEQNREAFVSAKELPESVLIFGIVGVDWKSHVLVAKDTIDSIVIFRILSVFIVSSSDTVRGLTWGRFSWIFKKDGIASIRKEPTACY